MGWESKYNRMRDIADRIYALRLQRAKRMLAEVGMELCNVHNCAIAEPGDGGWGDSPQNIEEYREARRRIAMAKKVQRMLADYTPSRVIDRWIARVR